MAFQGCGDGYSPHSIPEHRFRKYCQSLRFLLRMSFRPSFFIPVAFRTGFQRIADATVNGPHYQSKKRSPDFLMDLYYLCVLKGGPV
jgi:hypothetical protein